MRKFGIAVWDNPFDHERPFSLQTQWNMEIPLRTRGSKIFCKSRVPTEDEMRECPKINMASESPWNTTDVIIQEVMSSPIMMPNPMVKRTTFNINDRFKYHDDMSSDDILLNEISSSLTSVNPNTSYDIDTDDIPRIRTYISHERHN